MDTSDILIDIDKNLKITYWNKGAVDITAILSQDAMMENPNDILPDLTPVGDLVKSLHSVLMSGRFQHLLCKYWLGINILFLALAFIPQKVASL